MFQHKKGDMEDVASMFSGAASLGEELGHLTSAVTLPTSVGVIPSLTPLRNEASGEGLQESSNTGCWQDRPYHNHHPQKLRLEVSLSVTRGHVHPWAQCHNTSAVRSIPWHPSKRDSSPSQTTAPPTHFWENHVSQFFTM